MDLMPNDPIFEFPPNVVYEVRKKFNLEKPGEMNAAVKILEEWVQKQSHFIKKDFRKEYLENSIIMCKGSVEKVKRQLEKICTYKTHVPKFFAYTNIKEEMAETLKKLCIIAVPKLDSDLSRTFIVQAKTADFNPIDLTKFYAILIILIEYIKLHDCCLSFLLVFDYRNIQVKELMLKIDLVEIQQFVPIYIPTVANYRVVVTRWFGYDEDAKILDYYRYIIMMSEYALRHDYCLGYEVISDTRDIEFGMVKKINPILIHKALTIVTEAMGQRLRMIHFISGSMFLDSLITIFKQGLTAKLAKRIQIHSKFDTIYEHVARENLPSDFGGDLMNIAELTKLQHKEFSSDSNIEWIKSNEKATTDETRRLTDKFNEEYMGMPGSFKVLCVD